MRREGIYSTDLTRIRQKVREGALERLANLPGAKKKTVSQADYDALKKELEEKERALADLFVELTVFRKKRMGVRGSDIRHMGKPGAEIRYPVND